MRVGGIGGAREGTQIAWYTSDGAGVHPTAQSGPGSRCSGKTEAAAEVKVDAIGPVDVNVKGSASNEKLSLAIAASYKVSKLSSAAETCIRSILCNKSNKKPTPYVQSVIYGSMIRLNIKNGSYSVNGKTDVWKAHVSFSLSATNVDIDGGILGDIRSKDDVGKAYPLKIILDDLAVHDFTKMSEEIRSRTKAIMPIGYTVGVTQCD